VKRRHGFLIAIVLGAAAVAATAALLQTVSLGAAAQSTSEKEIAKADQRLDRQEARIRRSAKLPEVPQAAPASASAAAPASAPAPAAVAPAPPPAASSSSGHGGGDDDLEDTMEDRADAAEDLADERADQLEDLADERADALEEQFDD
jgi:Spy/CpxP family protein refolding chaperone